MASKLGVKQLLPVEPGEVVSVRDQFGFLPTSVIKPSNKSKKKWKDAYFDDGEVDIRNKGVFYDKHGNTTGDQKMSEFHAGIAENIVRYWSLPGAKVVDPFSGRATRATVATKLGRDYYGYEITPRTYRRNLEHFKKHGINPTLYNSDGTLMEETPDEFADMIYTCPPYFNIEKYESVDGQLSDIDDYDEFMKFIDRTADNCYRVLKPGGFMVWVIGDFRINGKLIDFCGDSKQTFTRAGFEYHDIIIMENISPMAVFQAYSAACKRYAPKVHEYIIVFRKPGDYIVPDYCHTNHVIPNDDINEFFQF